MKSVRVSPSIFSRFPFELADHVEKNLRIVSRGNEPIGILFFLFNRFQHRTRNNSWGERGTRLNYRIEQRGEGKGKVALELHAQTSWSRSAYLRLPLRLRRRCLYLLGFSFRKEKEVERARGREKENGGWMEGGEGERDWRR